MHKKWGLALGAGGFHGIAHLGVLRTLTDEGFFPDLIAGTSAGALAAGLYASGVDLGTAADTIASMNTPQMLDFSGGLRSMVPGLILSRMGIIQGDLVEQALEKMTEGRTLAEANPPVAIEAVDLSSGELVVMASFRPPGPSPLPKTVYYTDATIAQAMRASISIPGLFVPRQLFGRQLVDGGVRDMVPTRLLRSMGAEVVVAVDLGTTVDNRQEVTNFPAVIMRALALLEREATRQQLPATADVLIAPVLPPFTSLDKKQIEEHIRLGAGAARAQLPVLRRLLS